MNKAKAKGCGCLLAVVALLAIIGSIVGGSHGTNNSSQGISQPSSAPAVSQPALQDSQPAPPPASQPPTQLAGGNGLREVHDPGQVTGSLSGPCQGSGQLPDPSCTPGSIDPAVAQANIAQTICRTGYTSTVRPPEADTEKFKFDQAYPAYGVASGTETELDHLVPLELGGSNDASNLWPESPASPNPKDDVERALHDAVCSGQVSLADAQQAIASDWTTADAQLGVGGSSSTTAPAVPAPAVPAPAPAGGGPVVHPGSFCSPPGAAGVTSDGHPEVCSSKNGAEARWRSAS
jgi:hypothetical protein